MSQFIRDVGFRYYMAEDVDFTNEVEKWQSFLIESGDLSYFYRATLEAINQNLNQDVLIPFALARRVVFFFIPAPYSNGLKVEDISAIFSDVVGGEDLLRRGNMPPGLYGLFVLSFGWLATVFLMPWIALFLKWLDVLIRNGRGKFRDVVLSLTIFSVVLAFRGDESSSIYFVLSSSLLLWAITVFRPKVAKVPSHVRTSRSRVGALRTEPVDRSRSS